jgi:N-acetylglutamate synthase/N-acetylornithine aminotransferase
MGNRTESSFAYIQIKCHENDKAIITSDGTIIYFSQKGVVKKYKFDKFNGGSGGWIEPDLNILDGVTFTDDEISNKLRADRIKQKSEAP